MNSSGSCGLTSVEPSLTLKNSGGEEILRIFYSDEARLSLLFDLARRQAVNVNQAVADCLREFDSPSKKSD